MFCVVAFFYANPVGRHGCAKSRCPADAQRIFPQLLQQVAGSERRDWKGVGDGLWAIAVID